MSNSTANAYTILAMIGWALLGLGILLDLYNIAMLLAVWRTERKAASAVIIFPLALGLLGVLLLMPVVRYWLLLLAGIVTLHTCAAVILPRVIRGWERKRNQAAATATPPSS